MVHVHALLEQGSQALGVDNPPEPLFAVHSLALLQWLVRQIQIHILAAVLRSLTFGRRVDAAAAAAHNLHIQHQEVEGKRLRQAVDLLKQHLHLHQTHKPARRSHAFFVLEQTPLPERAVQVAGPQRYHADLRHVPRDYTSHAPVARREVVRVVVLP